MKSSLPPPTKAQSRRMGIIKREIGCIACRQFNFFGVWADAHHLISEETGERISHSHTIPLCKRHHDKGRESIHGAKRWFRESFGTDEALLAETDRLVAKFEANTVGGPP